MLDGFQDRQLKLDSGVEMKRMTLYQERFLLSSPNHMFILSHQAMFYGNVDRTNMEHSYT